MENSTTSQNVDTDPKEATAKIVEPMTRKEWYDVVAPANFEKRQFAKTICNKTQGLKIAGDNLRGRVYEVNQADLVNDAPTKGFELYVGGKTTHRYCNMEKCGFREYRSEKLLQNVSSPPPTAPS